MGKNYQPSLREMVDLDLPIDVRISPRGKRAAWIVQRANWKENRYDKICMVCDLSTGQPHQLTRSGVVLQIEWLSDSLLVVLRETPGENGKAQIWAFEELIGEGVQLSDHKGGVQSFKPFAGGILYLASDPERQEKKKRKAKYGSFTYFEQEHSAAALYFTSLPAQLDYLRAKNRAAEEDAEKIPKPVLEVSKLLAEPLSIAGFVPSPRGDSIYLNCRKRDDLVYYKETLIYRIELDAKAALDEYLAREKQKQSKDVSSAPANQEQAAVEKPDFSFIGKIKRLTAPKGASIEAVSPDGEHLLVSYQARDQKMYTQADLWTIESSTAASASDDRDFYQSLIKISGDLDRSPLQSVWKKAGIFTSYIDHQVVKLARLDGLGGWRDIELQGFCLVNFMPGYDVSETGQILFLGTSAQTFPEIYLYEPEDQPLVRLTEFGKQIEGWETGQVEEIRWTSRDGIEIEGTLRKPANFDPAKKYPLVFVVHGGPRWFSPAYLLSGEDLRYYPSVQFSQREMLVLKPNYRGSEGRGQAFMELNVDNLGVGDQWDLESAVDYLVGQGCVDPERIGCMGWSQGGYISAFVGLNSRKFKAVSVGAGIADWYTYHISNDIPDFTTDYLSASPFEQRDVYTRTAPITGLSKDSLPMLIQHGSADQRVPLSNALELYRGLKAMGVQVELFIYPGFGHPITRPRENFSVMYQNYNWFCHHLLGDALDLDPDK